jgi:hypothetical protein
MRIARDQSYPVADRTHGAVLRPTRHCPDGRGVGTASKTFGQFRPSCQVAADGSFSPDSCRARWMPATEGVAFTFG